MSICIACAYPSDHGHPLCIDCRDGIAWAKSQRLQLDAQRRTKVVTDWGQIACEMLGLFERSPDMRQMEDKAWAYLLGKIHPIHGRWSEDAYANTRSRLCEYLHDHLGLEAKPCSKATPNTATDWLWFTIEVCQFLKDNPKLKQVEPEVWEWMLNQTYPLPPNHAPTARNMTKAILEQFMGDYGPTIMMVMELEGRAEAAALAKQQALLRDAPELVEANKDHLTPGLLTPEAAQQLESEPRPTTKKRGRQ